MGNCKFNVNVHTISLCIVKKKSSLKKHLLSAQNICLQDSRLNFFHPKSWGFRLLLAIFIVRESKKTALLSRGQKNIYIYFSKNTCTYSNHDAAHISRIDCAWK